MKFAAVVIALTAASVAAAGPISFEARDSTAVELNDIDTAAIEYLVRRGLFDESALEARGLFGGGSTDLHITFHDPTGSISAGRKKEATKALKKAVSKADQKKYPYCDVTFGNGGSATYRCFSSSQKKIGQQGPAGAIKI